MTDQSETLTRDEAPRQTTWNAESLFASWEDWETELAKVAAGLDELGAFAGSLADSPVVLADYLAQHSHYRRRLMRLTIYAGMAADVDTHDTTAQANRRRIMSLQGRFAAVTAFDEPEMQALGDQLLDWAADDESSLAVYRHYFDDLLRKKPHTRSAEVEKILGMVGDAFSGTWLTASALTNTDLRFEDAVDSQGQSHPVHQATVPPTGIQSTDRQRRQTAWESFYDGYLAFQHTLASNYLTLVKQHVFLARARGYESVLHARLEPYNLPVEVFHTLIDAFQANLETWHRFWAVKARALGVDKLHPWDVWAPLTTNPPAARFPQAVTWIGEALAPLGEEYVRVMRRGCLQERWVDHFPNAGKMQGARANLAFDSHPFIVMGYDESLMSMSVLAHELGHAMHSYLMDHHQPDIYNGGISSAVAETASNFTQAMTRAYLLDTMADDRDFQLALIDEAMFNFHRYFFQMPTLARFEHAVFQRAEANQPLNVDILNGLMRELLQEGYGDTMAGELERSQITWAQFIHLYAPFYTFQYAVGISAAHDITARIQAGEDGAAGQYLDFVQAGSSRYPLDLFQLAGVDMTTPEPVERAFAVLAETVSRLEGLTKQ